MTIVASRSLRSTDVMEELVALFIREGLLFEHILLDYGSDLCACAMRMWLARLEVGPLFIEPGVPGRTATVRA